jgi:hypothetical protein
MGCDSFLTINLTIPKINSTVTQTGGTLTASSTTGAYQWLNCIQGMPYIQGAIAKTYKPAVSGSYAVVVTDSSCSDTSICHAVTVVGLKQVSTVAGLTMGPNPNNGSFDIQLPYECKFTEVIIRTISGKMVYQTTFENTSLCRIDGSFMNSSGIYLVEVKTATFRHTQTLSIQK